MCLLPAGRKVQECSIHKEVTRYEMSRKLPSTITSLAAILTTAWLGSPIPARGQAPAADKTAPKVATTAAALPRTPDGQPDIQGIYVRRGIWGLADDEREANGPRGKEDP